MTTAARGPRDPGRDWDELVFRITLRDVYDRVTEIGTKVDVISTGHIVMDATMRELSADAKDHEHRIRAVERRQWPLPTLAIIVSLAALAATVLINVLK